MELVASRRPLVALAYRLFAVAAVVTLLLPAASAVSPSLAGWTPNHDHVYVNGVPVPHTHPYDSARVVSPAVMTFCAATVADSDSGCLSSSHEAGRVGFLFGGIGGQGSGADVHPMMSTVMSVALADGWLSPVVASLVPRIRVPAPTTPPPRF